MDFRARGNHVDAEPKEVTVANHPFALASRMPALALLFCAAAATPVSAASFDFLFSMDQVTNDNQLFLNLTVGKYGYDRVEIGPILPRLRSVESDLPVVLFLARKSATSPDEIVALRARGFSWSVIFGKLRVAPKTLFVGIDQDPGPPYGKAWGYWKKNPASLRLTDADIVGLVQIQIGSRWAKLTPYELARAHGQGKRVAGLVATKKGRPWQDRPQHAAVGHPGKGKPRGNKH
jgi:hypothetical protein